MILVSSRARVVLQVLLGLSASAAWSASGTIEGRVQDSVTHFGVQATVRLEGPESLTFSTDKSGYFKREVTAGPYREEYSASGYGTLRSNHTVEPGKKTRLGAYLDSDTPPEEERAEVIQSKLRSGYTLLHDYIVDRETAEPIPGMRVRLLQAGVETQTDSRGHFWLSVPTPSPKSPAAMGADTLVFEKPGYKILIFRNFGITDEEMGGVAIDLDKGGGVIDQDATHPLMRNQPEAPKMPSYVPPRAAGSSPQVDQWLGSRGTPFVVSRDAGAATAVTIPSTIKVGHQCTMINNSITCASWDPPIALEAYVTNGLPSEWPASWADDSLKAGAVAYRTRGAYFVAHPLSANYDICDIAYCQRYAPTNPLYQPTRSSRAAVAATTGIVLTRFNEVTGNHEIFNAEYAVESNDADDVDGNGNRLATCGQGMVGEPANQWPCMKDPVCTGKRQSNTHSRGMCQRGSQRWASGKDSTGAPGDTGAVLTTPRDWRCILNHYYNASSNSVTVDPTANQTGAPGTGWRQAFLQGAPTFGQIAYDDVSTGPVSVRIASAADGSGDRLLAAAGLQAAWGPDPKGLPLPTARLVYRSGSGLAIINADGTGKTQITTNSGNDQYGNPKYDFNPAWSPPGDKIAFCSTRSGTGVDVWTVSPDGTGLTRVSYDLFDYAMGTGPQPCYLSWSPDGKKIAFTGDTASSPSPLYQYDIYTMNAVGPQTRMTVAQLTSCLESTGSWQSVCINPSWSPDGKKIVFENQDYQGDNIGGAGIYTINSDGSGGPKPVYQSATTINRYPKWSTDGTRIVFGSNRSGKWGIWSMNADGTGQVQIVGGGKKYRNVPAQIDCSRCAAFDR